MDSNVNHKLSYVIGAFVSDGAEYKLSVYMYGEVFPIIELYLKEPFIKQFESFFEYMAFY